MRLRQVRCFVAVARLGSFTAAAKALRLSQPSLGVHVRQLEQRYGVVLFNRHARGVTLTAAGELLLKQAEALLEEADRTETVLRAMGGAAPLSVTLGMTPTAEATLAPDLLQRCTAERPRVKLVLVQGLTAELRRRTEAGEIDAALCYGPYEGEPKALLPLYSEDLYLVGLAEALGQRRSIAFAALEQVPLVLDRRFQAMRRLIEDVAAATGVPLDVRQEVEPVDVKRALIRRHGCFTIVPYGLFLEEIRQGQMAARRITNPPLRRTMYLARRKGLPAEISGLLTAWLDDIVAAAIASGEVRWRRCIRR